MIVDEVAVQNALRAVLTTLSSLPAGRAWEQFGFTPTAGQPYITDALAPAPPELDGLASAGHFTTPGLYLVRWFLPQGQKLVLSQRAREVLALFPPGRVLTASDGTVIDIPRQGLLPYRSQVVPTDGGRAVTTITIPFRAFTPSTLSPS